jgi:hypothetical protein
MGEVPLARMWVLPDGTTCLLLKNSRTSNWELRVVRGSEILRQEDFGSPIVAMDQAKAWKVAFIPLIEATG